MTLLVEFFKHEFDDCVQGALLHKLNAGLPAYFEFNIFNVRLDPESGVAVLEDVLDPDRSESVDLIVFLSMVERGVS